MGLNQRPPLWRGLVPLTEGLSKKSPLVPEERRSWTALLVTIPAKVVLMIEPVDPQVVS